MKKKTKFSDIITDPSLVKQTLMASAFPALLRPVKTKEDGVLYEGFLPGFKDAKIKDVLSEDDCVQYLQDMLDEEIENLIVYGKSLPDVENDSVLIKKYPGYKIVYLDINVKATKEDCNSCDIDCFFRDFE